jgi:hypothetical protein
MRNLFPSLNQDQPLPADLRLRFLTALFDVLLILLAAVILLPQNLNWLFSNNDAELLYALDQVGREFGKPFMFTNINPVAGLGALMSQLNPFLHPIHYLWYATNNLIVPYAFLAVLLYSATFSLGQTLGYPLFPSRVAGYLVAVFWVPFFGPFSVDIMARIAPWATYIMCMQLCAWSLFVAAGTNKRMLHDLLLCMLFCASFVYAFLVEFSRAALSAPFSALFFGAVLLSCASKRELVLKLFALGTCLVCFIVLDVGQIMATATQLSVRMVDYVGHNLPVASRSYLTSLFRNDYHRLVTDTLQAVPYLRALALIGMAFGLGSFVFARRLISWRLFCVNVASAAGFFGLYAVSREYMVANVIWPWPAPAYFEWIAYPIYALSGVAAVYFLARIVLSGLRDGLRARFGEPKEQLKPGSRAAGEAAFLVLVASIIFLGDRILSFDHKGWTILDSTGVLPPAWVKEDPITELLANSLSLRRDREYRGTFLSTMGGAELSYQMRNFIPMMVAYPGGHTLQVQAVLRLINQSPLESQVQLLRAFGISYAQYPQALVHPDLMLADDLPLAAEQGVGTRIFLYHVVDPNLAGYTPSTIERREDWGKFVDTVAGKAIDFRTTVFLRTDEGPTLDSSLVAPFELGPLIVTADGLDFRAATHGMSLVVLPRLFSNCYRWRPFNQRTGSAELVRVNFIQLGILFRGEAHGRMIVDMGWLAGSACLAQDVRDLYRIGMRKVTAPQTLYPDGYLGFFGRMIARSQQRSLRRMLEQP